MKKGGSEVRKELKTFWALNGVMFQGALSDNIFKLMLAMLAIRLAGAEHPGDREAATSLAGAYKMIVDVAFILPFILAVSVAGWLSDRFSKVRVTRGTKAMEAVTMSIAVMTLAFENVWLTTGVLFLMGLQSALFSPSKYGILPELLPNDKLAWGNGILQGWTFLAIIVGTIAGPWIYGCFEHELWVPGIFLVVLASLGFLISMLMNPIAAASPAEPFLLNPLRMLHRYGREILEQTGLRWSVFGMVVWWMAGVMCQGAAILVAKQVLDCSDAETGLALLPIVVGIGLGCMLTGMISKDRIELGLVPFGALAMFLTCTIVWWATPDMESLKTLHQDALSSLKIRLPALMGLVGLVCGFFIVPLQSYVLKITDPKVRGGVWAASNVLTALGMIAGALTAGVIVMMTSSPGLVFLVGGLLMLLAGIVICLRFPMIPLRFLVLVIFNGFYKVRAKGLENIPDEGGALVAANHQSYIDAVLLSSLAEQPIRFIMSDEFYRKWFLWPFARLTRSIPVHRTLSARSLLEGLKSARMSIKQDEIVGIFPEGQMTRTGMLLPFEKGFMRVMKGVEKPIIPIAIDGAYDSSLSVSSGFFRVRFRLPWPWPRRRLNVAVGEPLSGDTSAPELRKRIIDLMTDAFAFRKERTPPLHRMAIRSLRKNPFARKFTDPSIEGAVSGAGMLAAIVALGSKLKKEWEFDDNVAILLPPSIPACAVNMAASTAGKVSVNMNYTSSLSILEQITKSCDLRLLITSRIFLKKSGVELPDIDRIIYLEDVRKLTREEKFVSLARGLFLPVARIERLFGRKRPARADDVVTYIFTSGSTGTPKGVPLTHWNLGSNILGAWQMFQSSPGSKMLGMLPFFHSFGYLTHFWLPLAKGIGVAFCPNPLDAAQVGLLAEKHSVTHLLATPTFLSMYSRRDHPGQFGSIEVVLTGAEKLRSRTAEVFEKRFGIRPMEGYGCTECSPIVTMNSPDYRETGIFQQGVRSGSIGRPLPGVTIRIEDLDTGKELLPGKAGMLLVKGPNVMSGYLRMPEESAEVLKNGWYVTGDVARVDEHGFVTVTDRLSRFSKISGEMVPHIRVEDALQEAAGMDEMVFAVTGIPDPARGERLVVLYTVSDDLAMDAAERLKESGLPMLWIPKQQDFIRVDSIPILGTGKPDLKRIREVAGEDERYQRFSTE